MKRWCVSPVKVEEALGAVDVVEGGEGGDAAVDRHGVRPQLTLPWGGGEGGRTVPDLLVTHLGT